jgi:hypothetical protein
MSFWYIEQVVDTDMYQIKFYLKWNILSQIDLT